jgi:drug/metabolite transporter (DMT)-like permease
MSGGVLIGLLLAAVCALGTNVGWLIKHRGAQQSARMRHRHPLRSVRVLFRSRWFVAGLAIATVGGLLHIAALALAPISIVQAVMAGGLVILAVVAEPMFGWRVSGRQWSGVILSVVGLSLLTVALPEINGAHNNFSAAAMAVFEAAGLLVTVALLLGPRILRLSRHDGVLIGAAAGALFGVADLAVKALLGVVHHGLVAVLLSPWLFVALGAGLVAQYVSARSLQTGDGVSVTALTGVAVNVFNIAGGIIVFGDPIAHSLTGTLAESVAFALICAAAFLTPVPTTSGPTANAVAAT